MINFLQIDDRTHIGIQGISSIHVDHDIIFSPETVTVGSRTPITIYETYGGEHTVTDDGASGYYQKIVELMQSSYNWTRR